MGVFSLYFRNIGYWKQQVKSEIIVIVLLIYKPIHSLNL